jgi:SAM-dependent methyltransferase
MIKKPTYYQARNIVNVEKTAYVPNEIAKLLGLAGAGGQKQDLKILDIGCGYGRMLKGFRDIFHLKNLKGLEIEKEQVDSCKKENLDVDLIDDLKTYLLRSQEKYDCIILWHVIEHLKKDEVIPILELIYENALSDNGKLIVATPNAQSLTGAFWAYEDFTHNLMFSSGSLFFVLRSAGFENIKFMDIYGADNVGFLLGLIRKVLLKGYAFFFRVRNKFTDNCFFYFSQKIFTWQIKVIATKNKKI